ncbi:hypothetical protein NDA01_21410 [Trichocoleus desertorum AS-A10]|uniref:hypothetical protein n=1 Tax=Trichocoleus desertorum TaxID=1481672 RepID=UPI0032998158
MTNAIALSLEWLLRCFGVFWVLGGALTMQKARQAHFLDTALEAITQEKEDRLVSRFIFIGGILTLLSGVGLAFASRWALIPLGLLTGSQVLYFAIQNRRFTQAKTEEDQEEARIAPTTRNAFKLTVVVVIVALVAERSGILR